MTDDEINSFREKLKDSMSFPGVYMFKFIITSDNRSLALVDNLFGPEAEITSKESDKGKYTSVTARQVVMTVDEIIDIYKKAASIEGIMFL